MKHFATLFRKLADILDPKPPGKMLDLKDADVRALRDLRALPEWDIYLTVLDRQSTLYGEGMLASLTIEQMWERKGYILGIRRAGLLVDEVLQKEQEKEQADERRRSSNTRANDHRNAALYASPSWAER